MNLAEENDAVLMLVEALRGVISANFRRVSLRHTGHQWQFIFVLERDDERDREEIEDVPSEFEARYPHPVPCAVEIRVWGGKLADIGPDERVVFWRRED